MISIMIFITLLIMVLLMPLGDKLGKYIEYKYKTDYPWSIVITIIVMLTPICTLISIFELIF